MLYVGFVAPHFPLIVPREYLDLYPIADIPFPKRYAEPGTGHHPWVEAQDAAIGQDKFFDGDEARLRAVAAYFGLLSFVDAQIGLVLDALAELGLEGENEGSSTPATTATASAPAGFGESRCSTRNRPRSR